jgi:hypothetical protein
MHRLTTGDKLLRVSDRLVPLATISANLGVWLLLVPGNVMSALG